MNELRCREKCFFVSSLFSMIIFDRLHGAADLKVSGIIHVDDEEGRNLSIRAGMAAVLLPFLPACEHGSERLGLCLANGILRVAPIRCHLNGRSLFSSWQHAPSDNDYGDAERPHVSRPTPCPPFLHPTRRCITDKI